MTSITLPPNQELDVDVKMVVEPEGVLYVARAYRLYNMTIIQLTWVSAS